MFARVFFYTTLGINAVMTKITPRKWYNRLDETVLLGALPVKCMTQKLIEKENVRAMVSVNEDFELQRLVYSTEILESMGVERLQISTVDVIGTPSQEHIVQAVEFILKHGQKGHCVYVHCKAGRTRSATVAACYLMKVNQWNPQEVVKFLKKQRPQLWLRKKQLDSIACYYETVLQSDIS